MTHHPHHAATFSPVNPTVECGRARCVLPARIGPEQLGQCDAGKPSACVSNLFVLGGQADEEAVRDAGSTVLVDEGFEVLHPDAWRHAREFTSQERGFNTLPAARAKCSASPPRTIRLPTYLSLSVG
ncbi:MAG: hypothetical protein O3A00_16135 [Planctomycetota bacterium]|nr:hypothetical protein [Planctomycetota bacterium]